MAACRAHKKYTIYEWVFLTMGEKFENQFQAFSKFGESKSDGTTISLSQSDKWMKQAKVIDNKTCTTTDTGIAFKKFKSMRLSLGEYNKFIDDLAATKKLNADNLRKSLAECGAPGTHSAAGPKLSVRTKNMIARLTDPNNFTGIHKYGEHESLRARRDAEAGSSSSGSSYRAASPSARSTARSARRPIISSRPASRQRDDSSHPPVGTRATAAANSARRGANSGRKNLEAQKSGKKQRPTSPDHRPRSHKPFD